MLGTHRSAHRELNAWASSKGFILPDELSEQNQDFYQEMTERNGTDFDEAYSDYLVTSHKQELRRLERESKRGNDPDLRQWVAEKIPVWESHLNMAERAEDTADEKDE